MYSSFLALVNIASFSSPWFDIDTMCEDFFIFIFCRLEHFWGELCILHQNQAFHGKLSIWCPNTHALKYWYIALRVTSFYFSQLFFISLLMERLMAWLLTSFANKLTFWRTHNVLLLLLCSNGSINVQVWGLVVWVRWPWANFKCI